MQKSNILKKKTLVVFPFNFFFTLFVGVCQFQFITDWVFLTSMPSYKLRNLKSRKFWKIRILTAHQKKKNRGGENLLTRAEKQRKTMETLTFALNATLDISLASEIKSNQEEFPLNQLQIDTKIPAEARISPSFILFHPKMKNFHIE